jgi:hypothetical protein
LDKSSGKLKRSQLAEGLSLPKNGYVIFKDYASQLEYIRSCKDIREMGLYVELGAYQCHAFMDFRFVNSDEWGILNNNLNGAGVKSMDETWVEMFGSKEEKPVVSNQKSVKKKTVSKKQKVETNKKQVKNVVTKKSTVKKPVVKKPSTSKTVKKKPAVKKKVVTKSKPKKVTNSKKKK